jgi:hypothetical protein
MYSASFCQIRSAVNLPSLQVLDQAMVASPIQDAKNHLLLGEAICPHRRDWVRANRPGHSPYGNTRKKSARTIIAKRARYDVASAKKVVRTLSKRDA